MIYILLATALSCPATLWVGWTSTPTKMDVFMFNAASKRCGEKFPNSPCLKKFILRDVNAYRAICSAKG